jgi:5-methylcytosine-specific restriction endonuclease McrA
MGGPRRKYTKELLADVVARSNSVAEVLRRLDLSPAGGTHAHISRTIKAFAVDTSHFGSKPYPNGAERRRRSPEQILVRQAPGSRREKPRMLQRALIESGRLYECGSCGVDGTWRGAPLRLEIDHVDGDFHNNEAWNLRFLCPNCHSQTDTFAGRSRGKDAAQDGQLCLFMTPGPPPSPSGAA